MASKPPPSAPAWKQPASCKLTTVCRVSFQPSLSAKVRRRRALLVPVGLVGVHPRGRDGHRRQTRVRRGGAGDGETDLPSPASRSQSSFRSARTGSRHAAARRPPSRDEAGHREVERLTVGLAVVGVEGRAAVGDERGRGVAERLEEPRLGEGDDAAVARPGLVWMTSDALPAWSWVRIVSPYLSFGVGLVVDRDVRVLLHVRLGERLVGLLHVVGRGEGEGEAAGLPAGGIGVAAAAC